MSDRGTGTTPRPPRCPETWDGKYRCIYDEGHPGDHFAKDATHYHVWDGIGTTPRSSLIPCRPPRWTAYSGDIPLAHGDTRSEASVLARPRLNRGQRITLYVLRERDYPFAVIRTEAAP